MTPKTPSQWNETQEQAFKMAKKPNEIETAVRKCTLVLQRVSNWLRRLPPNINAIH